MYEELYIIKNGARIRLDLKSPSGITLNFKSNIFGDLSKITCSYTYTFKLPLTLNNRIAFDNAEDIRHDSGMTRLRLTAEFVINGIKVFDDANLYVDAVDGTFQAVMTWGVVKGLETLKDNDLSLRELPFSGLTSDIARFGIKTDVPRPTAWKNTLDYYIPYRKSEAAYLYNNEQYLFQREVGSAMLPVVPVYRIIEAINDYYGTQFYFGDSYDGSTKWNSSTSKFNSGIGSLISFGAVPLVKRDLTDEQYDDRTATLTNVAVLNNSFWGVALTVWDDCTAYNVLSFDLTEPKVNNYYELGNNGSTSGTTKKYTFYKKSSALLEQAELDGYILVTMANIGIRWKNSKAEYVNDSEIPKLIIYKRNFQLKEGSSTNGEIVYEEAVTLEGTYAGAEYLTSGDYTYEFYKFKFDFRASEGRSRLELEDFNFSSSTYPYFMSINGVVRSVDEVSDFKIIPKGNMSDNVNKGWEVDIVSNLPDIGCLEFIKSLYYMIGAFPSVDTSGRIIPRYYSDLYNNITNQNALDWSAKLIPQSYGLPEKTTYAISGFAQNNYYLMKNDDLDNRNDEDGEDIYEHGFGCIECNNQTLDKEKSIVQVPYYGPFLQDATRPSVETGKDMKYTKYNDDDTTEFTEAKPAIGILCAKEECTYQTPITDPPTCLPTGTYAMLLEIWNGFATIDEIESYVSLQDIMAKPIVIMERFRLNEIDLRDIDYSVPVYIDRYNAYFAIVSIQRDSNGQCKCELIKLP